MWHCSHINKRGFFGIVDTVFQNICSHSVLPYMLEKCHIDLFENKIMASFYLVCLLDKLSTHTPDRSFDAQACRPTVAIAWDWYVGPLIPYTFSFCILVANESGIDWLNRMSECKAEHVSLVASTEQGKLPNRLLQPNLQNRARRG